MTAVETGKNQGLWAAGKNIMKWSGGKYRATVASGCGGVTLFELLVAVLMLGLISSMIYSVLNVGIKFSEKGERKIFALDREKGFLDLLQRQIQSVWYDRTKKEIVLYADGDMLRLVTRSPLILRNNGVALAVYRINEEESTVYYMEKKDFYNAEYHEEDFMPSYEDMQALVKTPGKVSISYDSEEGRVVVVEYGDKVYEFFPRCGE